MMAHMATAQSTCTQAVADSRHEAAGSRRGVAGSRQQAVAAAAGKDERVLVWCDHARARAGTEAVACA